MIAHRQPVAGSPAARLNDAYRKRCSTPVGVRCRWRSLSIRSKPGPRAIFEFGRVVAGDRRAAAVRRPIRGERRHRGRAHPPATSPRTGPRTGTAPSDWSGSGTSPGRARHRTGRVTLHPPRRRRSSRRARPFRLRRARVISIACSEMSNTAIRPTPASSRLSTSNEAPPPTSMTLSAPRSLAASTIRKDTSGRASYQLTSEGGRLR